MKIEIDIKEENYKKFKAALILTGEEEDLVLNKYIEEYSHNVFEKAMGKKEDVVESYSKNDDLIKSPIEQKKLFVNWFRSLIKNGRCYNPGTINVYTNRIENACADSTFETVPVYNLFEITDLSEFLEMQKQIKKCEGYNEYDAKTHNGFTAALKKYEDFLRFQITGNPIQEIYDVKPIYNEKSNIHRWTFDEDLICCRKFLEYYVIEKSNEEISKFLAMLSLEVPAVSEGSLRMKVQNIKYLSMRAGFSDSVSIKWLSQYSVQCEKAFKQAVKELGL